MGLAKLEVTKNLILAGAEIPSKLARDLDPLGADPNDRNWVLLECVLLPILEAESFVELGRHARNGGGGGTTRGDVGLGGGREGEGRRKRGRVSETRWMVEHGSDEGGVSLGSKVTEEGPGTGGTRLERLIVQSDQVYQVRHEFRTEAELYHYLVKFGDILDMRQVHRRN